MEINSVSENNAHNWRVDIYSFFHSENIIPCQWIKFLTSTIPNIYKRYQIKQVP